MWDLIEMGKITLSQIFSNLFIFQIALIFFHQIAEETSF